MAFFMNNEQLKSLPKLNNSEFIFDNNIFIENEETLIKGRVEELNDMIRYLTQIPNHNNVIKPVDYGSITYSENPSEGIHYNSAYKMEFLHNAKSIRTLYNVDVSYDKKLEYSKQLFDALHFLHQYIVVGNISSKYLLVCDDKAYITHLENSKKLNDKSNLDCLYDINSLKNHGNTIYTDIVKLYLECLSLILEIPLTNFLIPKYDENFKYKDFYKVITSYSLPKEVLEFLKISLSSKKLQQLGDEAYDFERFITPEVQNLKRSLSFFKQY